MEHNILLLTGWGTTCECWQPIIPVLKERFQVNCLAPPWEIRSIPGSTLSDVDQYIQMIGQSLDSPTEIIAWSMGGLIAIKLASQFRDLVGKVIFIASTPNFVSRSSRQPGLDSSWFETFKREFDEKPYIVLKRFLALQAKGDEFSKQTLIELREHCQLEQYNIEECRHGLRLLEYADYTNELTRLRCDSLFIHGECDAVLPLSAGRYAASLINSNLLTVPAAGHAPHVSHPLQVAEFITRHLS